MSGIRAELVFQSPSSCPVASVSETVDRPVEEITWTSDRSDTVTEQFTADRDFEFEEAEPVFSYGSQEVYEFDRDASGTCICESVQQMAGPVSNVHAVDGDLHMTLHAGDVDSLRDLLADLSEKFDAVRVAYLVQDSGEPTQSELIPVDLDRLTDRQREVLEMAHEMGYFAYPRRANAGDVAQALDIESSTFIEHLNAAQSKLLEELLR